LLDAVTRTKFPVGDGIEVFTELNTASPAPVTYAVSTPPESKIETTVAALVA
jgi:hypothetical protein